MKINKKHILLSLGYIAPIATLTGITIAAVNQNKNAKYDNETIQMNSEIYKEAESFLEESLANLSSNLKVFSSTTGKKLDLPKEVMQKVEQESKKFLKTSLNKNNVNVKKELVDFTKEKVDLNDELKKYYESEKDLKDLINNKNNNSVSTFSNVTRNKSNLNLVTFGGWPKKRRYRKVYIAPKKPVKKEEVVKPNTLEGYAKNLLTLSHKSAGFSVAAAALAAGYWAAAWFFGLSIPSAIAATAQAGLLAAEAITYRVFYDQLVLMNDWNEIKKTDFTDPTLHENKKRMKQAAQYIATIKLVKSTLTAVETTTKVVKAVIQATAWAAPAAAALLAIMDLGFTIAKFVV